MAVNSLIDRLVTATICGRQLTLTLRIYSLSLLEMFTRPLSHHNYLDAQICHLCLLQVPKILVMHIPICPGQHRHHGNLSSKSQ